MHDTTVHSLSLSSQIPCPGRYSLLMLSFDSKLLEIEVYGSNHSSRRTRHPRFNYHTIHFICLVQQARFEEQDDYLGEGRKSLDKDSICAQASLNGLHRHVVSTMYCKSIDST
jgi:hypothetical protein